MAKKWTTWTGAVSTAWATAGNWTNGLPDSDDTAVIDGAVDIVGGAVSSGEVDAVYVASTYTGDIGSSGTPLEIDVADFQFDGGTSTGVAYVRLIASANAAPVVTISGGNGSASLYLAGTVTKMIVNSTATGTFYLGVSASKTLAITELVMVGSSNATVDASTTANIAWASAGRVHMDAGALKISENFGATSICECLGGTLTVSDWTNTLNDTLNVRGGTVNWNAGSTGITSEAYTVIKTVNVYSGTFSLASNKNAFIGLAFLNQYGGTVNLDTGIGNVVQQEAAGIIRYAGSFIPPVSSTVTVASIG